MKVAVTLDKVAELTEYVESTLSAADVPMPVIIKMNIALDELFSNIVKFSGATYANITCGTENSGAYLIFEDDGKKYNPLDRPDPDISLDADERDIGGLGIFMVKKSMTEVNYKYSGDKNILTLRLDY